MEAAAGACLVALARHHWTRLPASETGPAREQLLEVALKAHQCVKTGAPGRTMVLLLSGMSRLRWRQACVAWSRGAAQGRVRGQR